ncbi:MAG: hypothetical protein LBT46_01155 [Planctomycetaceae bacterium]|jgi:hypothetical protein|nr:hypothetical protein [Planctomycetaceae bacterium]
MRENLLRNNFQYIPYPFWIYIFLKQTQQACSATAQTLQLLWFYAVSFFLSRLMFRAGQLQSRLLPQAVSQPAGCGSDNILITYCPALPCILPTPTA